MASDIFVNLIESKDNISEDLESGEQGLVLGTLPGEDEGRHDGNFPSGHSLQSDLRLVVRVIENDRSGEQYNAVCRTRRNSRMKFDIT